MLYVKADGSLGAKVADLGTAVKLSSNNALVTDPTGTTGYAGEYKFTLYFVVYCICVCTVFNFLVFKSLHFL